MLYSWLTLKLRDSPPSASQLLGPKVCATTAWLERLFQDRILCSGLEKMCVILLLTMNANLKWVIGVVKFRLEME